MMHCMHFNERLEFGMESVSKVTHKFIKGGEGYIPCRVAQVDLGLDMVDPGLAPDGSKCGYGKISLDKYLHNVYLYSVINFIYELFIDIFNKYRLFLLI